MTWPILSSRCFDITESSHSAVRRIQQIQYQRIRFRAEQGRFEDLSVAERGLEFEMVRWLTWYRREVNYGRDYGAQADEDPEPEEHPWLVRRSAEGAPVI